MKTNNWNNPDNRQLSSLIKKGDHKAFRIFFEQNYPSLLRFLQGYGMDKDSSEDLIQKAFLIIWEKRDRIDEDKSLRAYLYRTIYTRMINEIKFNARFDNNADFQNPDDAETPEDHVRYEELVDIIHKALAVMPSKRKAAFEFCFQQQFTYKEAAEIMCVSRKTVENHMAMAFKDVRKALKTYRQGNP